ncbi:MAG: hypothetical protein K2W33_11145, partial [Burkholderiales bacterium]|nr:hypothetical protein [Burkholderiales bacterium]
MAQVLRTAVQGLTLWLPGTLLAATVALLAAAWLWTGTTGSLARLLNTARPWVPALAQLNWHTPGATVRNGGQLGTVNWQHNGLAVRASNVNLQWQWLAHNPEDTTPQASRLRLTLTADDVHVTDRSPASTTPLTPPTHLALPWPFDSWAAPVELVFDVGQFTHAGAQPLVLQRLSGRHVYNPGAADWQHTLAVQTQVRSSPDKGTVAPTTSAHYTLHARAQAHAPLALTATLTGDISGSLPASAAPAKLPAHAAPQPPRTWQGRLTATLNGTLATPQATLDAHATLTSQAAPGQQAPSAQLQARLAPWAAQPLSSLQTQVAQLDLAALWPTLPHTRLSGHAKASPTAANTWAFDVALANAASGPVDQHRLPVARLATTGHVAMGEAPLTTAVVLNTLDAQVAGGQVAGHGQWTANAWSGQLTATALHGPALHSALPATTLQGALRAGPDTTHAAPHSASLFNVQVTATSGKNGSTIDSKQTTTIKRQASFSSEFVWDGRVIDLRTLALRSDGAVLSAQGTVQPQPFSASGQAQLRAPGLQADAQGQLSPLAGAGSLAVNLHQAAPLAQWLARLPVWPTTWPMPQVSGAAKLAATWTGGWEQDLQVTATAQASQLTGMLPHSPPSTSQKTAASLGTHTPAETWAADHLSWTLSGGLANWQSSLAGQLRWQQWAAHLQTTASGAMDQPNTGQARLHTFALALSPHNPPNTPQAPTAVRITLPDAAQLKWDTNGLSLDAGMLQVQPGTASASPPPTPAARLRWDRSTWAHSQLTSSGTLTGVTVQLARTLTQLLAPSATQAEPLAGWTGDLALGGPWQLRWPGTPLAPALLAASLTRQSGDLQAPTGLAASPGSAPSAPPGATSAPTPNATAPAPQQAQATGGTTRQTLGVRTASLAV